MIRPERKKDRVRLCVWMDEDVRNNFSKFVRWRHGGDRGGTGKEVEIALRSRMREFEKSMSLRKSQTGRLIDLAMTLEEMDNYPTLPRVSLISAVKMTVGKDMRTIKKYVRVIQDRSERAEAGHIIKWNVSRFVEEAYRGVSTGASFRQLLGHAK